MVKLKISKDPTFIMDRENSNTQKNKYDMKPAGK
jgi:hypothetical protein